MIVLRPNNQLKVHWSNRWRSSHQSMDGWISNCPCLFETRVSAHDEGLLRSTKRSTEGRVQTKQRLAGDRSIERPQVLQSVEGLVNSWVKCLSAIVEQLGQLKVRGSIKVTSKANWLTVDHSRPIKWRRPLESAWLKAAAQGRLVKGRIYPCTIVFISLWGAD